MLKRLDEQVQLELDLLREARDTIKREGWTQESYRCGEGVCLMGSVMPHAMGQTCHGAPEEMQRSEQLSTLLGFEYSHEAVEWNDVEDRTVEQVYARIDKAINRRLTSC